MVLKVVCFLTVVAVCIQQSQLAPRANKLAHMSESELMEKFSQFLSEDKQVAALLATYNKEAAHAISKRQAEDTDMLGNDGDLIPGGKQDGFLDRAAKFVLELVQRFLKWINTD